ncbi:histidine kinase [Aureispira sp. CCB-QB1]|uniref:tetratricopeptide repeat-containing sensor histidine kinase n=1 Tax=Aureispira sp. CCB-QB1 TaxID=1313421 RepID=UPI000697622E|nr:histidine kinase [Aureispira sp. CCB-QB1]
MYLSFLFRIFCFLFPFQLLLAQENHRIDSLEKLADTTLSSDQKSELYHSIAKEYLNVDFEKAEAYENLALKFCSDDNHSQLGDCYGLFAAIYAQTSRSPQALTYVDSSIYFYEIAKDSVGIAIAYNTKGAILIQLQQFEKGAEYLYKNLQLNEQMGDTASLMPGLQNLLEIYRMIGEHNKALETGRKVLSLAHSTHDISMQGFAYQSIGAIMFNSHQIDSSLAYYLKSIPAFKNANNYEQVALSYGHIAHLYAFQKKKSLALEAIQQAIEFQPFINSQSNTLELQLYIAHTYYAIENYNQSIAISQTVLDTATILNDFYFQEQSLNRLIKNMVQLNDFEAAYNYQKKRESVLDSFLTLEKQNELLNLETKYQTEKIEQENKLLAQEKAIEKIRADRNRQLLYLSIFAIILIIIISILLVRQSKINAARLTNQLKNRLLRNQMSPHFIFNSLVAIQNFVYKSNPIQAGDYLASFAQLIRAILENSMEEYIPLEKEIQWLDNYLKLQLLRFDNNFDYSIDLDENIDLDNMLIPPMLTQPFIENALEHGLQDVDYKGKIEVKINISNDILHIKVYDNGVGLEANNKPNDQKKHQSLALKITKERLQFLNKKRGKKIFFNMKSLPSKGTLVSFSLPLNYKY